MTTINAKAQHAASRHQILDTQMNGFLIIPTQRRDIDNRRGTQEGIEVVIGTLRQSDRQTFE